MDQLKEKIDSYVHLIVSVEELLKDTKKRQTSLIKSKFKSIVNLEIDILTSLDEINKQSDETKQRKLVLRRLRDIYNEAHDNYETLYANFTLSLQQNNQNKYDPDTFKDEMLNDEMNDIQTGLLRKFEISGEQEFDLERIRQRQAEFQKIEESIDSAKNIFHTLCRLTHEQEETIDQIEGNIDKSLLNTNQGAEHLNQARAYYISAMKKAIPIAGAALAAGATGPVGLIYGFKIGVTAVIALGGLCGYVGGLKLAKKINHKAIVDG